TTRVRERDYGLLQLLIPLLNSTVSPSARNSRAKSAAVIAIGNGPPRAGWNSGYAIFLDTMLVES
ncbi:MAG: hypothetical protein ACRDLA_18945, partial [Thermoleophilaceae bacterium]